MSPDKEKLRDIVRKAAAFSLPSNTQEFHLDMFTNSLMASGVKIGKNTNVPRWIPVTERLPERLGNRVLVTDGSTVALGHYEQPHWINLETDEFFSAWGWEITHWMPLPEAPKDGDT